MHRTKEQEKADRREVRWAFALLVAAVVLAVAVLLVAVFEDTPEVDAARAAELDIAIVTTEKQAAARAAAQAKKGD